jgi:hypothetical protein
LSEITSEICVSSASGDGVIDNSIVRIADRSDSRVVELETCNVTNEAGGGATGRSVKSGPVPDFERGRELVLLS